VSFDLVVLSGAGPLTPDAARDAYLHVARGGEWSDVLQPDTRVAQFVAAVSARMPEFELDESPAHAILSMSWSAPKEFIEFCESTASQLGLNLFDPQDFTLYAPGREPQRATPLPEKTLICERCGKLIEPGTPHAESPRLMHMECLFQDFGSR
jgi:hypothetical protein